MATARATETPGLDRMSQELRIRAVTCFVSLHTEDFFPCNQEQVPSAKAIGTGRGSLSHKLQACHGVHQRIRNLLEARGYEVQSFRVATNPFGEWLRTNDDDDDSSLEVMERKLEMLDRALDDLGIDFCSVGPAMTAQEAVKFCPAIVAFSHRFYCSARVSSADVECATAAARCILAISRLGEKPHLEGGFGNFRFCASYCEPFIPFFPAATSAAFAGTDDSHGVRFALGLENGSLLNRLCHEAGTLSRVPKVLGEGMTHALAPLDRICRLVEKEITGAVYVGVDASLNPSLIDPDGSVAAAIECLSEVTVPLGGPGTMAATAALTTAIQSIPSDQCQLTGYCGLMLPVCEDRRLAELGSKSLLDISHLLCVSSVCGVGVDTVPVPGDAAVEDVTALLLDMAGIAGRWNKNLSVRIFPVPGKAAGDVTTFDSPYLCNTRVFSLSRG